MNPPPKPPKKKGQARQLRALQRSFATGIMRPLTAARSMRSKNEKGESVRKEVGTFIKPNDRLTSFERLEIYNKQYWFRILDSLYEDFPGLRALIGDSKFHRLSLAYLEKYPSASYTLRDLGSRLPKYLAQNPEWLHPHEKLGLDLVRLEWAHINAFDGGELPPLEIDDLLDGGDPTQRIFHLQPYLSVLACAYPVDNYLITARQRKEPRSDASNAVSEPAARTQAEKLKRPQPEKTYLAIHRSENSVYYKRLQPGAYELLAALQKGLPLQTACERALRRTKEKEAFAESLQTWFMQWAAFGWFCHPE